MRDHLAIMLVLIARFGDGENTLVGSGIAPFQNILYMFIRPRIQINRLHSTDMGAHATVDAGAPNTDEDA
jgi:hypothetical protein